MDISIILDVLLRKKIRDVMTISIKTDGENFLAPKTVCYYKLH